MLKVHENYTKSGKSDHEQNYRQIEQTKTTQAKPRAKKKKNKNKANLELSTRIPKTAEDCRLKASKWMGGEHQGRANSQAAC